MNQNQDRTDLEEPIIPEPDAALLTNMEKLYPLTFSLRQLKLWKTIMEYEAFAIQMPDGEPACCLLTGAIGDFISLTVYLGETGWNNVHKLWENSKAADMTEDEYLDFAVSQSCLQIIFCCKDDLADTEIESLRRYAKANGFTFRGKNAYFCYRNVTPYHMNWFLENENQIDILETALHAVLDIAAQLEQGKTKQELGLLPYSQMLPLYVPAADGAVWNSLEIPAETETTLAEPKLDETVQQKIRRMKKGGGKWECQLFPFSSPVLAKEGAPFFPFLLMILDTKREQLLPQQPLQYNADILQKALDSFVQAIIDYGRCPKSIAVCDERTEAILSELCHKCGILLLKTTRFAMLDEAKASFLEDMEAEKQADDAESEKMIAAFVEHLKDMTVEEIKDDAPLDVIRWLMVSDIPEDLMKKLEKVMEELQ